MNWPEGKRAAILDPFSNTAALAGGCFVPLAGSLIASIPTVLRAVQLPLWLNSVILQPYGTWDWFQGHPPPWSSRPLPPPLPTPRSLTRKHISTPGATVVCWQVSFQTTSGSDPFASLLKAIPYPEHSWTAIFLLMPTIGSWKRHWKRKKPKNHLLNLTFLS